MKWLVAVVVGCLLLLGVSVTSRADDVDMQVLPLRGTPEESIFLLRRLLRLAGWKDTTVPGSTSFFFQIARASAGFDMCMGWEHEKPNELFVVCMTDDDPPAARRLGAKLRRIYLDGP